MDQELFNRFKKCAVEVLSVDESAVVPDGSSPRRPPLRRPVGCLAKGGPSSKRGRVRLPGTKGADKVLASSECLICWHGIPRGI